MDSHLIQSKFVQEQLTGAGWYHDYLRKKVSRLLSSCFPLLQEFMGETEWEKTIAGFLPHLKISGESISNLCHAFYLYLEGGNNETIEFEYALIKLFYQENTVHPLLKQDGNKWESKVVLNQVHQVVFFKGRWLFLYRHPETYTVESIELTKRYNNVVARLQEPVSLHDCGLNKKEARHFYDAFYKSGAILGFLDA